MLGRVSVCFILSIFMATLWGDSRLADRADQQPQTANGSLPPVYYDSLLNGLQILIVERPATPKVTVGLMIKSGAAFDLVGREGTADLTARMVVRGSQSISNRTLAELFQDLGVDSDFSVTWDATRFSFEVPPQNLVHFFPTLAEILLRPTFPEEEVATVKRQRLVDLQGRTISPAGRAARLFSRFVFDRHPYARPVKGSLASLKDIRSADLRRHYRRFYLANNAVLTVVGDVSAEALMPLIRPTFGALRRGKIVPSTFRVPAQPDGIHIRVIDKPNSNQAIIWLGTLVMPRGSDDFIPLQLLDYALGGSPNSQLASLTRALYPEQVKFATHLDARVLLGAMAISATCRSRFVPSAISTLLNFIKVIRNNGITDAELITAKQRLIGQFPRRLQTNRQIVDRLEEIELYGLGRDSLVSFVNYIDRVTPELVKTVAARYLSDTRVKIVVIGRAAEMVEDLNSLGRVEVVQSTP